MRSAWCSPDISVVEAICSIPSVHGQEVGWNSRPQTRWAPTFTVTHILVVGDPVRSLDFWVNVLGAELYHEYGGTSVVLRFPDGHLVEISQSTST
jgi:hypothetical protein